MVQAVFEYGIPLASERLDQAEVSHVPGREQQCAWIAAEFSEFVFERMVGTRVTIDQVCSTAARAVLFDAFNKGRFHIRVVGEAQVVVAAKADDLFAVDDHLGLLRPVTDTAFTVEMVSFSLLQFFIQVFQKIHRKGAKGAKKTSVLWCVVKTLLSNGLSEDYLQAVDIN